MFCIQEFIYAAEKKNNGGNGSNNMISLYGRRDAIFTYGRPV